MIYAFEEIGPDLARPPLAARRAMLGSGVAVPLDTWQSLPLEARQQIANEGTKLAMSEFVVKNAVSSVLKRVRFMGPVKDPRVDVVPQGVMDAVRQLRPLTLQEWQNLSPLDRYTLVAVSSNSRLLYRALEEMTTGPSSTLSSIKLRPWVGPLAHAEVRMSRAALGELAGGMIKSGKAVVLARAAGIRAARSAHDVLDGYAEKWAGPVELDARLDAEMCGYVWQAHVSTVDGEFFAAASVLAASTAAIALRDAIAERDPTSSIGEVSQRNEAWTVGSGAFGDEATVAVGGRAAYAPRPTATNPAAIGDNDDVVAPPVRTGVPVWITLLLMLSTLAAFAAAGFTIYRTHP